MNRFSFGSAIFSELWSIALAITNPTSVRSFTRAYFIKNVVFYLLIIDTNTVDSFDSKYLIRHLLTTFHNKNVDVSTEHITSYDIPVLGAMTQILTLLSAVFLYSTIYFLSSTLFT